MTQKAVAAAVGEREDTFSKILKGAESYELKSPLIINVLNAIDVPFSVFSAEVERASAKLYAADN